MQFLMSEVFLYMYDGILTALSQQASLLEKSGSTSEPNTECVRSLRQQGSFHCSTTIE